MAKTTVEKLPEEKVAHPTPLDGDECEQQHHSDHRYEYDSSDEFSVTSDEDWYTHDCDARHLNEEIKNEGNNNNKDKIKSFPKSNMRRLNSSALLNEHKKRVVQDQDVHLARVSSAPSLLAFKQGLPDFLSNRMRMADLVVGGTNNVGKKMTSLQSSKTVPTDGPATKVLEEEDPSTNNVGKKMTSLQSSKTVPTDGPATKVLEEEDPRVVYSQILEKYGICSNILKNEELTDFFIEMGESNVTGYTMDKVTAMRGEDIKSLRDMLSNGETLQVCNRFGESIIHSACRRGSPSVLRFLVDEANVSLAIKDDYGKNPAHDACWTIKPNFEVVKIVVTACPDLLLVADKRGSSPLDYTQKSLWSDWCAFLKDNEDILIPKQLRQDVKVTE